MSDVTPDSSSSKTSPTAATESTASQRLSADFKSMWFGLLGVYLMLFLIIGYLAFLMPSPNPGSQRYVDIVQMEDPEARAFLVDSLKMENAEHAKQRGLATQSFNVVLGALLGFLSSSAAFYLRQAKDEAPTPPTTNDPAATGN